MRKILTVRRSKVKAALLFLQENHPLFSNITINSDDVLLPEDDIPDVLWNTMVVHDNVDEDSREHSGYVPADSQDGDDDTLIMESSGVLDLDGNSVVTGDQLQSAVHNLQGTMLIPHGPSPTTDYNNPSLWIGAYPWLFPYGSGGPEIERKRCISLKKYIKHLLLHADARFRLDISFKFHVFNILQKRGVSLHTSLMIKQTNFSHAASKINNVTHETLVKLCNTVSTKTQCDNDVKTLMQKLTSAGSKIQGSAYSKKVHRREIHGLMVHFGMPAFWISICPTDIQSPILLLLAGEEIDYDFIGNLENFSTSSKRAEIAARDPIAASLYFNVIIDAFTEFLLGYGKWWIVGTCIHIFWLC